MYSRPPQAAVTAPPQSAVARKIGYLLFNLVAVAVSQLPFFGCQSFSRHSEEGLIVADIDPSARLVLHALGFEFTHVA